MSARTVEVPLIALPDGRDFLSDEAVAEEPALKAFIDRFSNYWSRDEVRCGWVSPSSPTLPEGE